MGIYRRIVSILMQQPAVPSQRQVVDEIANNRWVKRAAARVHDILDGTKRSKELEDDSGGGVGGGGGGDGESPLEPPRVTPEIRSRKPLMVSPNPKSSLHKLSPFYHIDLDRMNNPNIKVYDETITRRRSLNEPIREQIRGVRLEMKREVQQDIEEIKYHASPRNWFKSFRGRD